MNGHDEHTSTLVDILRRRAREQPDRLAYVFLADGGEEEARLTYAQLDERARAVAALLQELGVDRDEGGGRALLLYPTGADYVAAFYGCLYAGVTAVPAYPPRPNRPMPRIQAIAADARAGVALTTSAILAGVERRVADLPDLQALAWRATDALEPGAAAGWREPSAGRIGGDTLAFLQYTSGSTASPKGVMVSHANLLHNEALIRDACGHREDTPCVSWLPLYHDLGLIGNMIQSLYVGTPCTLMAPVAFLQSPIRWLRAVSRYRAHTSGGPNFAYDLCARKITPEQAEGLDLSSWRVAFNGAEPVRAETLERFAKAFEPYGFRREALFPCYGLAETTLIVSAGAVTAPPVVARFGAEELARHVASPPGEGETGGSFRELVGCGRVLGDLEVAIVEPESLVRRGEGEVGEVWVAGGSVARGYWDRPDVTAETFGARTADGSGPFLRTGDLGFLLGGELYITGRIKDLIIIRGSNHYPQDIERTVETSHSALVPGAAAAFSVDTEGEERLVVVQEIRRDQRRADVDEIAAAARAALAAEHELQLHALVLIRPGSLPKTSSGKVQRRRCRQEFLEGTLAVVGEWRESGRSGEAGAEGAEPADLRSWLLARLGVAGESDLSGPVAALGLDSLRAIELSHEIEERTGNAFSLESFFGGLTVGELVDGVVNVAPSREGASPSPTGRLSAAEGEDGLAELSAGQRALWFLWRLEPASPAYNIASAVRVRGPVDAQALHRAFQRLVERHPALRATFTAEGGEPVQRIQPDARLSFVWEDAAEWSDEELREHLAREAWRPFDLETGPLLRVTLLGRPEGESVLLLSVHHIVSDMWSLAVLVRELGTLYAAATAPTADSIPALPPLEVSYADWARWQRQMLNGIDDERLRRYWEKRLGGELPALDMPTDRPRPPVQTDRGAAEAFRLSPALSEAVRDLGRGGRTTSFMTLLAAYQATLHRWTGQTDILVGAPTSGRGRAQLSNLVGYFVNPVVLRANLEGEPTFAGFLEETRQAVLGAFEHADYPFPTLVERLAPVRDPSRSPIFQAMFALQNAPAVDGQDLTAFAVGQEGAALEVGGLRLEHLPLPQRIAQFDLTLSIGEVAGVFAATLDYNADLFDAATARRLAAGFETLLATVADKAADPGRAIADLPLLPAADRRQVLVEWNATGSPFRRESPVPALFRRQAAATPEEPAVVWGDLEVTYAELARRATELANRLRALGAGPATLIGLCADRSPELVVGMLGILESGAGYAPLDPETPPERLVSLLDRAGISHVITQEHLGLPWPSHLKLLTLDRSRSVGEGLAPSREGASPSPPSGSLRWAIAPESPACLLYTSGSTGEPKGVLLTHRNLANLIASFQASYAPGPGDAILPLTSVASASFAGEVLPALCSGATVVLPDKGELLDFERTVDLIARRGISILSTVPSLVAGLNAIHDRVPKLRLLLSGGEALSPGDVDRLLGTAEIVNGYGLTETTICSTIHRLTPADFAAGRSIPIGAPIFNHRLYVLDDRLEPRPVGCAGELFVAGEGLARGYFRDPAATAERFMPNPFSVISGGAPGDRMYRTGDLARWLNNGSLEYLGRLDQQVKVRGFRVELGEIEAVLGRHPGVRECVVVARNEDGETRLAAYVVGDVPTGELPAFLRERLPEPMIPAAFVAMDALPLNANGKVDRKALPAPERLRPELEAVYVAPRGEVERTIAAVWREMLGIDTVGVHDNFFDLGGHSLLMARVHARLREALGPQGEAVSLIDLFRHPTVASLARFVAPDAEEERPLPAVRRRAAASSADHDIAVIAVSGRFPGARDVEQLWRNLVGGVESISRFTDEELLAAGNDPELVANPNYVKAKGILGGVELFDAAFFGHSPRSAELTDPQHRVFLECAWEALELAGYDADRYPGAIGVFAGQSMNTYWLNNLYYHIDLVASLDSLAAAIGNDKDSLTTEVSYRMNLRGPSVLVQSSSSTSLTAVHYACQSLRAGECDMALAGGVSIHLPEVSGYLYHEGGTTDPEGHCRTFDAEAKGFVSGHGAGVVVLKRLPEAIADGDRVLAVIKGSACNNDGAVKVSYMAPSVDGHAEVVAMAQADAGVTPDTISYLEAHGTGTLLGDPIEVAALTQAFRSGDNGTDRRGYCALGSIKTNIGHLDTAAGVVGLIKTVLCLERRTLPPILHFQTPNPKIDFANSPFFVNDRLREWETEGIPRRAGVSSLGMGGTNTHMVLEEAPALEPSGPSREAQLLLLSARTATALDTLTRDLAEHLKQNPELPLADVAWTLQVGRKVMAHRRALVCGDVEEAVAALESRDPEQVTDGYREPGARPVAFLFSGQGSQYPGMGRGLYQSEAVFREEVDRCAELLRPHLGGLDLREVLLAGDDEEAAARLRQTALTQPALFVAEVALARLWMSWGVRPQAMLGHSIGEYAAACLAGVLSLEDALALVAERGRLMQSMPAGSMLAVPLPEPEVVPFLSADVSLAAVNRLDVCVLSGTTEAIEALERELEGRGIEARRLHTSHAFHSAMMDPILPAFEAAVRRVSLRPPRLPYLSNVTGTWITAAEATDPGYWVRQLRGTVRFAAGVGELLADPDRVLLEVGPGNALATAARQHPARRPEQAVAVSMRHPKEAKDDLEVLLAAVGRLWLAGVEVDGAAFWAGQRRLRVALPTYPFERKRFWVDPKKPSFDKASKSSADLADWFYVPVWKQSPAPFARDKVRELGFARGERWLVLLDSQGAQGLGERLLQRLGRAGADVIAVRAGAGTEDPTGLHLQVDPGNDEETTRFFANLREQGWMPSRVLYLWALDSDGPNPRSMDLCLHGLLSVARGLGLPPGEPEQGDLTMFLALTSGVQNISGEEVPAMERAVLTGACKAIPREYSNLYCRSLDIPPPAALKPELQLDLVERILAEALTAPGDPAATVVGLRGPHRWVQAFQQMRLEEGVGTPRLRQGGIYLITGGLGGIGLTVAEHLARKYKAKLMLSGRTPLPPRAEWEDYIARCAPDDRVGRRLRKLLELKALGAEVMVVTGDAADPQNLRAIRDRAMARFGRIDGIFHAAGVPGGGLIHTRQRPAALAVLGPKIDGTMAVMDTFNDVQPQFLVLFSSVTALLSQPGQADYAAGNAFLDAVAQATWGGPVLTVSINWDAWQEVGMAVETEVPPELRAWREESLRQGVSPAQGLEALERILRASLPQVAVSRGDFQTRVEESHAWKAFQSLEAGEEESREVHARPSLGSVYVAPRDETERRIAEIWQEILGIDRVGIHDNFFDLGGNSLVGLKVVSRLKRELAAEVSAVTLFEGPTVASLARLLGGAAEEDEDAEPAYADRKSRGALRREKLRRRKS